MSYKTQAAVRPEQTTHLLHPCAKHTSYPAVEDVILTDCVATAGIEDITLLLEDMGLNLQSMMASRFVRPFAEEVRKWEQRLSLVSECIEIWMLVQRKWMYLESIFMDSDDIRHQLPQVLSVESDHVFYRVGIKVNMIDLSRSWWCYGMGLVAGTFASCWCTCSSSWQINSLLGCVHHSHAMVVTDYKPIGFAGSQAF